MRRVLIASLIVCSALAAGCGRSHSTRVNGGVVTIYSSSPLTGARQKIGRDLITGEKLAIGLGHGRAGPLLVKYVALDSAGHSDSGFNRTSVLDNAQNALDDSSVIGYIGEATRGATRSSLPILSAADIPVISPLDPDPQLRAAPTAAPSPDQLSPIRTGYTLGRFSDARVFALAGPAFVAAFRHAFGTRPDADQARGYVAMRLLLEAVGRTPGTRADRVTVDATLGRIVARL